MQIIVNMKNNNYPTWLVPIEIAKELKEIGFNEPCLYYNSEAISGMGYQCIEIEERIHNEDPNVIELRELKYFNYNKTKGCTSIPTWEQVFEWFREKDIYGTIEPDNSPAIGYSVQTAYWGIPTDKEPIIDYGKGYKETRKLLLLAMIKLYKENTPKRISWTELNIIN